MVVNHQCFSNDYLRVFDLKEIFAEYSICYSGLHSPIEPLSSEKRHELTLKLSQIKCEMTMLVLHMKGSTSDIDKDISMPAVEMSEASECCMVE
jgi:hypothetical protein